MISSVAALMLAANLDPAYWSNEPHRQSTTSDIRTRFWTSCPGSGSSWRVPRHGDRSFDVSGTDFFSRLSRSNSNANHDTAGRLERRGFETPSSERGTLHNPYLSNGKSTRVKPSAESTTGSLCKRVPNNNHIYQHF